jgi:tricorn protease
MIKSTLRAMYLLVGATICLGQPEQLLLLQKPTLSRDHIAFIYAGDLWIAARQGGEAKRLTTGLGIETTPYFSPEGTVIAFTAEYDGNIDVYTIPASGGVPSRLTYHPGPDLVGGWTVDGKQVLFRSSRHSYSYFNRLFTIPVGGGFPAEIPLPIAQEGAYSPDGTRLAYVPTPQWQPAWKRYRGGQTKPIWIANLIDSGVIEKIPRDNSNDFNPMWVDTDLFESPFRAMDPVWSPDSRWLAYAKYLPNHLHTIFVYSIADKKSPKSRTA